MSPDSFLYRQRVSPYVRDRRRKEEAKSRTEYSSESTNTYRPKFTENLKHVNVLGQAIINNAMHLDVLVCEGLAITNSDATEVNSGSGDLVCHFTKVHGDFKCSGNNETIDRCNIGRLILKENKEQGVPQVVRIFDTVVSNLHIMNPSMDFASDLVELPRNGSFQSKDGLFQLHLQNVTLGKVITTES